MKKFILFFLLLLVANVSANAQKSYINVYVSGFNDNTTRCKLTGAVPEGINNDIAGSVGYVLNMLAEYGFEVEFMSLSSATINYNTPNTYANYVLSKKSSSQPDPDIPTIQREFDDTEAYEVARYNLQGLPVNKDEKGVQIVVYSNYTTKTIIKE